MDLKKEPSNGEYEQSTAGAGSCVKTSTKKQKSCVLVLSEMEKSGMVGRGCRMLKYLPQLFDRPNSTDLIVEKVSDEESDEKQVCEIRAAEYALRAELNLHMVEHQHRRLGSRFSSGLSENLKNYSGERTVQTYSKQTDLNAQLAKCKSSEIPQCKKTMCSLCGTEQSNLKRHMRIHTRETPYTCNICAKTFSRSDWLAKHMDIHRDKRQAREKKYPCDHCEKKYKSKVNLQNHLRTHTGERPFPCAICERRFYNKTDLTRHLMCHSDDRPFACSECGHAFKRLGILNKHKRIHTGEKPYSCSKCRKKFPYKYSLTMHSKICFL